MADDENVKVFCRVRPPNERESGAEAASALGGSAGYFARAQVATTRARKCVTVPANDAQPQTFVLQNKHGVSRQFTFDRVFGEASSQTDVFQVVGAPITRACLQGYNGTIFAYGQTGSGKTFTMQGPDDVIDAESQALSQEEAALRGLVPRVFDFLFENVAGSSQSAEASGVTVHHTFSCSFLEIYNERVYDLLDGGSTKDPAGLQLRESGRKGVVVDGLIESVVTSARQAAELMKIGARNRRVGQTTMNRESSRSHSVFILQIQSQETTAEGTKTRLSRFNLVDLAGSERQRSTEAAGERLKEAGSINKSLSALGNVIMGLVDQSAGKSRHVHYRDSKLTFLLKDSLGGNSKTFMIATISPAEDSSFETLSTLKFAQRAKMIRNNAVINEDASGSNVYLQREVARLQLELQQAKADLGRQGWHPSGSSIATNPVAFPLEYSADQHLDPGSDNPIALRVRELEEALASTLEKSDQLERSCDRLLVREEHLESLCSELKKNILHLKLMLRLRGSQGKEVEYAPSVDAVEWRIKYEELEDEFVRLQEEFARCQPADESMDVDQHEVRSEVESLNLLLMALTRQLALVVRDKHDLQDRLKAKQTSGDYSMDAEDASENPSDFSTRLEEALTQQANEFEARISSLRCEAQIMEEKTAETSLELLQMKQREAAYKIQLSDANAKLSAMGISLSSAEQEREMAKAMVIQHQVRIEDLSLQVERVKESVRLDFEQQLIDSRVANASMASKVEQLEEKLALLSVEHRELEEFSAELRTQLTTKLDECSTLSSQLEHQVAENKHQINSMEQLKSENSLREATLTKTVEEQVAVIKQKEHELQASLIKIEKLESLSHEMSQATADITRKFEDVESELAKTRAEKRTTEERALFLDEAVSNLQQEKQLALKELEEAKVRCAESEEQRQTTGSLLADTNERVMVLENANATLSSDLNAAAEELAKTKRSAQDLQSALDSMTRTAKELEALRATLQQENTELSEAIAQANRSIETLREEAVEAARSHKELIASLAATTRNEKEELVKEFEHKLNLKDDQLAAVNVVVQKAEECIQELQGTEQELRTANDQFRTAFEQFQEEATRAQEKHEADYSSMKLKLEREIQVLGQKAAEQADQFDHDRQESIRQRAQLESQMEDQARSHEMAVQSLLTEIEQLKHDAAQRAAAADEEAKTSSALRGRVDELTAELAEAAHHRDEARDAAARFETQLTEIRSSSAEQIESLTREVATKSDAIALLSSEKGAKVGELAELEIMCKQQLATIERLTIVVEDGNLERAILEAELSTKLREASGQTSALQAQLNEQGKALEQLESANAVLKENLHTEMAEKRTADESFAKAQTQWEEECRSLVDRSEAMQTEIETNKKTIDAMTSAMNQLEEQIAQAKGQASEKADTVSKLREELATLTQKLEATMNQHEQAATQWSEEQRAQTEKAAALEREAQDSKTQVADMQTTVAQLEQAGREAKDELQQKTQTISDLQTELTQLQKAHKAAVAESERLKTQQQKKSELVAREDDLKRRKAEVALAESSLRSDTKKLEKRNASITTMENELKALRAESAEAKQRIRKLELANRQLTTEKQKLEGDASDLRKKFERVSQENDKLVSHHNSRQKIQYHIRVKEQNNQLLEQVRYLTDGQFKLKRTLEQMRSKLKEKENVSDNSADGGSASAKPRASPVPASSPSGSVKARAKVLTASSTGDGAKARAAAVSSANSSQSKSPRPSKRPRMNAA